jgi:ribose/xylose/arabinose/galactoside ABC-type transport system permease subunit/ABC-type sugar transport system substrate-binding protein
VNSHAGVAAGMIAGILVGAVVGLVNGLLVTKVHLPPFIATLGMLSVVLGVAELITNGQPVAAPISFGVLGTGHLGPIPVPIVLMVVVAAVGWFMLSRTTLGRAAYAIGSNYETARLSGIRVTRVLTAIYLIAGLLAGLGGVIAASRVVTGDPAAGTNYNLDAIAAAVIGGASLFGGEGSVIGALIGALLMELISNGGDLLNISNFWQDVILGAVILVAVAYDQVRRRALARRLADREEMGRKVKLFRTTQIRGGRKARRATPFLAAVALAAAGSLAACSSSGSSGSSATSGSGTSGGKTIAVVPKSVGLFYWGTVHAGAAAAAKKYHVTIDWKGTETETDVSGQVNILQDFINRHVDGIAFAATDAHGLVSIANSAKAQGIPVVNIDSGLSPQTPPLVATDNISAAGKAADILNQLVGGSGQVALLPFVPSAATSIQRQQGFENQLKKYPGLQLAAVQYSQSDISKALSETENILTAHPNLKGIFAANEPGVIGAVRALQERGLTGKVKVVGFDNAPDEVSALANGSVQALIVQNPYQIGYQGVVETLNLINHKSVPQSVDTGSTVVTKANMNQPNIHSILVPPTTG